ncbi:MAG TPA: ABC transporter permease/substrate-binding protein [Kofleriaceae bacterium]|nr:ABC transporter permease/substrate-binding protein [Kofleriaceae bacterium]
MNGDLGDLLRGLPPLLADHLRVALVALVAGVVLSLPLALAVARRPRASAAVMAIASVVQTVPGLALLALMVPVITQTGGLGVGVSAFGFWPAVIALTLYAILPIARNAITGLRGVDASVIESARGLGMTGGQILREVELPLAAPVVAAGIRTATVWTVGAATLATPVGQPCLGNYIFAGLQTRNWNMLLVGVAAAAALAIALDGLLGALEHALARRGRRRMYLPLVALAVLVVGVLLLPRLTAASGRPAVAGATATQPGARPAVTSVRLGGKTFTEQYVLIEVLRARLAAAGVGVEVVESLGSTVAFDALRGGQIDAYVDYSGTIYTNLMSRPAGPPRWQVLAEVEAWLAREHGLRSLGTLGFENAYAIAIRRDTATQLGARSIADLAPHTRGRAIGGDYEFFSRREWTSVRDAYGLGFARTTTYDPTLLYDALVHRDVDAISAFSSDGRIAAHDLVVLDDPQGALPPYDAMILLGRRVADDARVTCALAPLRDALPVALVRQANLMVDRDTDKATPAAAAAWLLDAAHVPPVAPACAGAHP